MKRAAIERPRTILTWKRHVELVHEHLDATACVCEQQPGRFRKGRIDRCGTTRCMVCHFHKVLGQATVQEAREDERWRQQLMELGIDRHFRPAKRRNRRW